MILVARKPVFGGFANNTGADQPAHPRILISTFVIHFLENIICTGEISIFEIVSVAEETGLNLALTETPKTGFSRDEAQIMKLHHLTDWKLKMHKVLSSYIVNCSMSCSR